MTKYSDDTPLLTVCRTACYSQCCTQYYINSESALQLFIVCIKRFLNIL